MRIELIKSKMVNQERNVQARKRNEGKQESNVYLQAITQRENYAYCSHILCLEKCPREQKRRRCRSYSRQN